MKKGMIGIGILMLGMFAWFQFKAIRKLHFSTDGERYAYSIRNQESRWAECTEFTPYDRGSFTDPIVTDAKAGWGAYEFSYSTFAAVDYIPYEETKFTINYNQRDEEATGYRFCCVYPVADENYYYITLKAINTEMKDSHYQSEYTFIVDSEYQFQEVTTYIEDWEYVTRLEDSDTYPILTDEELFQKFQRTYEESVRFLKEKERIGRDFCDAVVENTYKSRTEKPI